MAIWCKSTEDHWGLPICQVWATHAIWGHTIYINRQVEKICCLNTEHDPLCTKFMRDHVIAWHSNQLSRPARSHHLPNRGWDYCCDPRLQRSTTSAALKYLAELNLQIWRLGKRNWGKFSSLFFNNLGNTLSREKCLPSSSSTGLPRGGSPQCPHGGACVI